jgi:CelD/BcsL family acetyltransferase involved in cellulose biosynthesis
MFGLRRGKIEFIGTPDSDYNDFIFADRDEQCLNLFFNYLAGISEKWDCVDLTDVPASSKTLLYLKKTAKTIKQLHKCPYAELPETPEIFLGSLKRKQRRELQRNSRRLEENFVVEFADYSNSAFLKEEMINFFELHQKRWKSRGCSGVFGKQTMRNFHFDIAQIFSQKGWLGLFLLKLSRVPAAALYGFKYKSKYYAYLSGFDPKYFSYNVGNLLFSYSIAECIKQNLLVFDFMRGAEEYKDRWNATPLWNKQITLTKCGMIENIQHWVFNEYWHLGNTLKYSLKIKP